MYQVNLRKLLNLGKTEFAVHASLIIQKITNHFANHLKDDETMVDESIEWIEKIFQIETAVK